MNVNVKYVETVSDALKVESLGEYFEKLMKREKNKGKQSYSSEQDFT